MHDKLNFFVIKWQNQLEVGDVDMYFMESIEKRKSTLEDKNKSKFYEKIEVQNGKLGERGLVQEVIPFHREFH